MSLVSRQLDYARRLGISVAADIPCVATSNTEAQAQAVIRGKQAWSATIILGFAVICVLVGLSKHASATSWLWLGGTWAGATALIIVTGRKPSPDLKTYRDPGIRIEVGPDEVVVTGPAGRDARAYAALDPPLPHSRSGQGGSSTFVGISLNTDLGYIMLSDDYYQSGRKTAGAILKRMDALGLPIASLS